MKNSFVLGFLTALAVVCVTFNMLGIYPGRYQHVDAKNVVEVNLFDQATLKEIKKEIPMKQSVVFDTWTGKSYTVFQNMGLSIVDDFFAHKCKVIYFDPKAYSVEGSATVFKKMNDYVQTFLENEKTEKQTKMQDAIIQGVLSK